MEKAYKFRFYPTKTQITILNCTFGCVRYVYNHFLDLKQELYSKEKKSMSYSECSKELTVLKQEKEWLKDVDKFSLQNSLKDYYNYSPKELSGGMRQRGSIARALTFAGNIMLFD